jgi:hypothetical protein
MKRIKFVGLDVHAETIAVAVAEQGGEMRSLGVSFRIGRSRFGSWSRNWDPWSNCGSVMKRAQRGWPHDGTDLLLERHQPGAFVAEIDGQLQGSQYHELFEDSDFADPNPCTETRPAKTEERVEQIRVLH